MAYTTIPKSTDYFDTKLWSGNSSSQAITGIGFAPDIVWGKNRSGTQSHQLLDIIRGANNILIPNTTAVALADSQILNSFDSAGYTLGSQDQLNDTGQTYVGWNWKAGGAGSSNTDGSINTTKTSANTTSGCSIITYTGNATSGATIGHGMGIKPSMVIVKELASGNDWVVYTQSLTAHKILYLNTSSGFNDNSVFFNDTEPTDSLITLGSIGGTNRSGSAMIAYCFSDVQGYSKQGSYIGNGNANGTFVYTGFKPAWILTIRTDGNYKRLISDNKRNPSNAVNTYLSAEYADGDASGIDLDFLSNGFKLRNTDAQRNANGSPYVYMAFAEAPLVSTNGIPATAR